MTAFSPLFIGAVSATEWEMGCQALDSNLSVPFSFSECNMMSGNIDIDYPIDLSVPFSSGQ